MNKQTVIMNKLSSLKDLEKFMDSRGIDTDTEALLDFITEQVEKNPMSLYKITNIAYYVTYSDDYLDCINLSENQKADLYNILTNLVMQLHDELKRFGYSPALHRLSFRRVAKHGIFVEATERD